MYGTKGSHCTIYTVYQLSINSAYI